MLFVSIFKQSIIAIAKDMHVGAKTHISIGRL